ncbi:MAG: hypothetical protein WCD70_09395 [Alphaproteobacteria bacterium]
MKTNSDTIENKISDPGSFAGQAQTMLRRAAGNLNKELGTTMAVRFLGVSPDDKTHPDHHAASFVLVQEKTGAARILGGTWDEVAKVTVNGFHNLPATGGGFWVVANIQDAQSNLIGAAVDVLSPFPATVPASLSEKVQKRISHDFTVGLLKLPKHKSVVRQAAKPTR